MATRKADFYADGSFVSTVEADIHVYEHRLQGGVPGRKEIFCSFTVPLGGAFHSIFATRHVLKFEDGTEYEFIGNSNMSEHGVAYSGRLNPPSK